MLGMSVPRVHYGQKRTSDPGAGATGYCKGSWESNLCSLKEYPPLLTPSPFSSPKGLFFKARAHMASGKFLFVFLECVS